MQPLTWYSNHGTGWKFWRLKVRKRMGKDKDKSHAWKKNQGINSPLPFGRQVFSHSQEGRAPLCTIVSRGDKLQMSSLLHLPVLYTECGVADLEYPFPQLAVLAVFPPRLPLTPSLLASVAV